jgi:hypothetical protein
MICCNNNSDDNKKNENDDKTVVIIDDDEPVTTTTNNTNREVIGELLARTQGLRCLYDGGGSGSSGSSVWMNQRLLLTLNASAMPTICNHNYFETAQQNALKRAIRGTKFFDARREFEAATNNPHLARGHRLEAVAKRKFEEVMRCTLMPLSESAIFVNDEVFDGKLGGTPDGITTCKRLVEIKCPRKISSSAKSNYNDQVQSYLHLLKLEEGILFQYVDDRTWHVTTIVRDAGWLQRVTPDVEFYLQWCELAHVMLRKSMFASVLRRSIKP